MNEDTVAESESVRQARDWLLHRSRQRLAQPSVIGYQHGVVLNAGTQPGNPMRHGGGKRGTIKAWSAASRRRLRQALLTLEPPPGFHTYGFTGTIPGPVVTPDVAFRMWDTFRHRFERLPVAMIWRLEVQKRGQLHWHAIVYAPETIPLRLHDRHRNCRCWRCREFGDTVPVPFAPYLQEEWWKAVDTLGGVELAEHQRLRLGGQAVASVSSRMMLPGAKRHAADVRHSDPEDSRGAWLRYLQDHSSKAKQEQIPEGVGRHWGITGRKLLTVALPDEVVDLTWGQYCSVRRAYERLATPSRADDASPFGRKLGWRCRRGRRGRSVCFVDPATVRRLITWAKSERPS